MRIALYIARQMLPWAAAALLCAALLFVVTQLLRIAPVLVGADASAAEIARDLGLLLVPVLAFSLAPAFAVAVFAVGGRMAEDGEIAALDAAGVPRWRTALGPIAAALALSLGSAALWLAASPAACRALREDAIRLAGRAVAGRIAAGRFSEPVPGLTIYAEGAGGGRLRGVFVADARDPSREVQITAAEAGIRGREEGALDFSLGRGEAFVSGAGGAPPAAIRFESLSFRARPDAPAAAIDSFLPAAFAHGTAALLGPAPPKADPIAWRFAFWRRVAGPIGFLALALASTALAFGVPWRRRGPAVAFAAGLFLAFHASARLAELLLAEGLLGPAAAALAPGVAVASAAAVIAAPRRLARAALCGGGSSVVQKKG